MADQELQQNVEFYEFPQNGEYTRRQVRSLIFHLLYSMEENDYQSSLNAVIDEFNRGFELHIPLEGEIPSMVNAIIADKQRLDVALEPLLENWRIDRLGVCTKLILRMSLWEMLNTDTPHSIVINEAIELTKAFSEKDAYKFVNGVLDKASASIETIKERYVALA